MLTKKQMNENRETILKLVGGIKREGIEDLIGWFEKSNFFTTPASTMFHGNFEGGLAAHSYEVYKFFDERIKQYSLNVPIESRIISGICHDCCKIDYYLPNVLKSGNVSESKPYKTDDSFPIGHGEKSVILLQKYIDLTPQETAIIRWHMGLEDPSWKDYKEKVEAQFPEVVLFQHVDKEISLLKKI